MRTGVAVAVVLLTSSIASAQSALSPDPSAQPAYPPPTYGPPGSPQYAPYGYQPQLQLQQLTAEDQRLLARGEISDGQWIGGGLVNVLFGFGVGQAIQGRWGEKGWIFTLGQAASLAAFLVGAADSFCETPDGAACPNPTSTANALIIGGAIGYLVFYGWGIADAFGAPPAENARLRQLRGQLGLAQPRGYALAPYIAPARSLRGDTTVAGLQLRF